MNSVNRNGHSLVPVETICGESGNTAEIVGGEKVYPHRPDLAGKRFYQCACGAYVGTHPDTCHPLGSPANEVTRRARRRAHAHFDPIIREVKRRHPELPKTRTRGYAWLAEKLGIPIEKCHIGMFDAATADRVVEICKPELDRLGIRPEPDRRRP